MSAVSDRWPDLTREAALLYYVAHRLFAAHDRALGTAAAHLLAERLGPDAVFLPFCDTDEEDLVAEIKGRRLFDLDTARLSELTGLLAVLHGPSLDDGVCFEAGYAAALGVPVVMVTTDFITYSNTFNGPALAFPDPLIETAATAVVRIPRLGRRSTAQAANYSTFLLRNTEQVTNMIETAVVTLLDCARHPLRRADQFPSPIQDLVYCEPSPYTADYPNRNLREQFNQYGYRIATPRRFADADPIAAARDDWRTALSAALLVIDASGPETPPGAAVLVGAFAALGRPVLACLPHPTWTFADGREPNRRNLMIEYAVWQWFTDLPDLSGLRP